MHRRRVLVRRKDLNIGDAEIGVGPQQKIRGVGEESTGSPRNKIGVRRVQQQIVGVIEIHFPLQLGGGFSSQLLDQTIERGLIVGAAVGHRLAEMGHKTRGRLARHQQILDVHDFFWTVAARPLSRCVFRNLGKSESPRRVHQRAVAITIDSVRPKRRGGSRGEQLVERIQIGVGAIVAVGQDAFGVVKRIVTQPAADARSAQVCVVGIVPVVRVQIPEERREIQFPGSNPLIAQKSIHPRPELLGLIVEMIHIQREPRREHEIRIAADELVARRVGELRTRQHPNPFRIAFEKICQKPAAAVRH